MKSRKGGHRLQRKPDLRIGGEIGMARWLPRALAGEDVAARSVSEIGRPRCRPLGDLGRPIDPRPRGQAAGNGQCLLQDALEHSAEGLAGRRSRECFHLFEDAAEEAAADTKGKPVPVTRPSELLDAVLSAGRKGLSIQRYKGLGEMNAEQLWETTLDPANRSLLRVEVAQADIADEIFTRLMGDVVEPRREFIQDNALSVANLDV